MNFSDILQSLSKLGNLNLISVGMENNDTTTHFIKHRFKDELILPYLGISNNFSFLTGKGDKIVITADGVKCKVKEWEQIHICNMEQEIQRLYHTDSWSFVKKWYAYEKGMESMLFVKMKLEKIEEDVRI